MKSVILMFETEDGVQFDMQHALDDKGLAETFEIQRIAPDRRLGENLVRDAVTRARSVLATKPVALILVDMVVDEKTQMDRHGFDIARKLRQEYPQIPLYLISSKHGTSIHDEIVSEASFEDADGVLVKSYATEHLTRKTLQTLLNCPRRRLPASSAVRQAEVRSEESSSDVSAITHAFRDSLRDPRLKQAARDLGEGNFWTLISECARSNTGTLEVMKGGRSGALVLTGRFDAPGASKPRLLVIKMSRDVAQIRSEVANYAQIPGTRLDRSRVPRLITPTACVAGDVAAMAVEMDEEAVPLRLWLSTATAEDAKRVASNLCDALDELYVGGVERTAYPWRLYYELSDALRTDIEVALQEIESFELEDWVPTAAFQTLRTFLQTSADNAAEAVRSVQLRCVEREVHGDLNAGNILVTPTGNVVLIDFASRRVTSVCHDLAKVERDVIYRACDAGRTHFSDWARIEKWRALTDSPANGGTNTSQLKTSIRVCSAFIREFRKHAARSVASRGDYAAEMDLASLHFVLKAIVLPDISLQKKVLAVHHADLLYRRITARSE